jgi:hypothetical protein
MRWLGSECRDGRAVVILLQLEEKSFRIDILGNFAIVRILVQRVVV